MQNRTGTEVRTRLLLLKVTAPWAHWSGMKSETLVLRKIEEDHMKAKLLWNAHPRRQQTQTASCWFTALLVPSLRLKMPATGDAKISMQRVTIHGNLLNKVIQKQKKLATGGDWTENSAPTSGGRKRAVCTDFCRGINFYTFAGRVEGFAEWF
mmetsp:Transcript_9430/g.28475  ORF Transcript_9430/g.28475 Transcript_9430/m.28475 type:complete len:153 (+) Transcript_9430:2436-2894(+)